MEINEPFKTLNKNWIKRNSGSLVSFAWEGSAHIIWSIDIIHKFTNDVIIISEDEAAPELSWTKKKSNDSLKIVLWRLQNWFNI